MVGKSCTKRIDSNLNSTSGSSLLKLGRAHCKVATLQEAYALTFQDTFVRSVERFQEDVKEYEAHKKKLESRRYGAHSLSSPGLNHLQD